MAAYSPIYTSVAAVQSKTGLSNTEYDLTNDTNVRNTIEEAEKELESITGRIFTSGTAVTEYFSMRDQDIIGNYQSSVVLRHRPVQSITEFKILDTSGTATSTFGTLTSVQIAAGTFSTTDYWLEVSNDSITNTVVPNGTIKLKTQTFPEGDNNVKVSYTYGYSSVPVLVKDLASCLAGIRVWIAFLGGQYNRLDSYSIPQQSVQKGDFYSRGRQNIEQLRAEAEGLLDQIGRRLRTTFFATGGAR